MSPRSVQLERDGWILLQSVSPKEAAVWLADKCEALSDPEFRTIYLEYDVAFDWPRDDPRLSALAERTERWLAHRSKARAGEQRSIADPIMAKLLATYRHGPQGSGVAQAPPPSRKRGGD